MYDSQDIMNGATVYIDEHECGTLDTSNADQMVTVRMQSRDCRSGSSIRIENSGSAGIAMCGIAVFKDTEFALQ